MEGLGNQSSPFSFFFLFTDSHIKREGPIQRSLVRSMRYSIRKPEMP